MGRESIRTSINPEVLKWARETAGWTIEEVSQKLGVKPETYQKIESGEKHLTLNVLKSYQIIIRGSYQHFSFQNHPKNVPFRLLFDFFLKNLN